MKQLNNFIPSVLFALLAFIIVLPLLPAGYILTLDQVVTAKIGFPSFTSPAFLYGSFIALLHLFLPSFWIQKAVLFLAFFLSGWGMYRLAGEKLGVARYFAGIFYMVNPFVYERAMAGQWNLLLGYSLFPFVVSAAFDFFQKPDKRKVVQLAVFATFLISVVIHYSLIFAVFFVISAIIYAFFHQEKLTLLLRNGAIFAGLFLIFNANWLLPSVIGSSDLSSTINQFSSDDLISFQSVDDPRFGLIFNLMSGYGFWVEVYDYFVSPKNIVFFWPFLSVVIILISLYGLVQIFKEKEKASFPLAITFVILFLLALDFAGGVALKSFANTVFTLYNSFPFLRGFREPQKLVGILMLGYAYFGSFGLYSLGRKVAKNIGYVILALFLILPFIYTPTVLGGFWGQLKPVFYPNSWEKANKILNEDKDDFLVLFFPWHQYMRFSFTNNLVVANPASYYFDKPVLSSQNYETKYLYTHDDRLEALHVEGLLSIEKDKVNLLGEEVTEKVEWGRDLSVVNVKYIILSKDDDWRTYNFLDKSSDLQKVFDSDSVILYQNLKWGTEEPGAIDN